MCMSKMYIVPNQETASRLGLGTDICTWQRGVEVNRKGRLFEAAPGEPGDLPEWVCSLADNQIVEVWTAGLSRKDPSKPRWKVWYRRQVVEVLPDQLVSRGWWGSTYATHQSEDGPVHGLRTRTRTEVWVDKDGRRNPDLAVYEYGTVRWGCFDQESEERTLYGYNVHSQVPSREGLIGNLEFYENRREHTYTFDPESGVVTYSEWREPICAVTWVESCLFDRCLLLDHERFSTIERVQADGRFHVKDIEVLHDKKWYVDHQPVEVLDISEPQVESWCESRGMKTYYGRETKVMVRLKLKAGMLWGDNRVPDTGVVVEKEFTIESYDGEEYGD